MLSSALQLPKGQLLHTAILDASRRKLVVVPAANYLPLQDACSGPNYFDLDGNTIYEIHVDNSGDVDAVQERQTDELPIIRSDRLLLGMGARAALGQYCEGLIERRHTGGRHRFAGFIPAIEATADGLYIQIAHLLQGAGCQARAATALAVEHQLEVAGGQLGGTTEFELQEASRNIHRTGNMLCGKLIAFTHVNQHVSIADSHVGLLYRDFMNVGFGFGNQVVGAFHGVFLSD
jgi:hypothetical protein